MKGTPGDVEMPVAGVMEKPVDGSLVESSSLVQDAKAAPPPLSYIKLYAYADTLDWVAIALGIFGSILNGLTFPFFAIIFGDMLNALGESNADEIKDEVGRLALYFLYLACVALVASMLEVSMFMWSGLRQTGKMRQRYLEAALRQDITYYDTEVTSGDILTGLNEDCAAVQNAISEKVGNAIHHVTTFIASIIIILIRGWKLALVMISLMPLIGVAGGILATVLTKGQKEISESYGVASTAAAQAISNIRTVASFQAEESLWTKYRNLLKEPTKTLTKVSTAQGLTGGLVNCVVFLTYGLAFWYGAKLVREEPENYSGGVVMSVIFGAIIGGFSLGQAAPNFGYFATGRVAGAKIMRMINREPPISTLTGGDVPKEPLRGNIELQDVRFSYPARPDVQVFKSLTLHVKAGQNVALVGASGSGKSTVIQLLQRFYDPASGTVKVDGFDIRSLSLTWYRDQVGLVSQEPMLFATTIRENIKMGRPGMSDEDVEKAARNANAHNFIKKLPEGYDTQVGERGVQLSGGQKQRIAISRALLKNPNILLLDEATSALDTVSEKLVQAALEKLAVGRTTVVVAHRLSTIRSADKICVMQNGNLVEEGTHKDLYGNEDSVYHSLVKLQQQSMDARADAEADVPDADALLKAEEAEVEEMVQQQHQERESFRQEHGSGKERESYKRTSRGSHGVVNAASFQRSDSKNPRNSLQQSDSRNVRASFQLAGKADGGTKDVSTKDIAADGKTAKAGEHPDDEKFLTEEEKAAAKNVGFFRLIRMNTREWPYIFVGVLASAALGVVMPLFAVFLGTLMAIFYYPDDRQDEAKDKALEYSIYFYALGVGFLIMAAIQGRAFAVVGANLSERVRLLFLRAVLYMEVGWFDKDENTSGSLTAKLGSDAPKVRGAVGDVLGLFVQNVVTFLSGYVIAFVASWKMTLVVTATLPLLGFSSYMQMKFFTGLDNGGDSMFEQANQTAHEGIVALRTVQSYNLQQSIGELYQRLLAEPNRKAGFNALKSGAAFGVGQFIMFAVYGLAFWYGGLEVEKELEGGDGMTIEDMLKAFFAILLASMGISQAQVMFPDVAKGKYAVARVFRVVDRVSEIDASRDEGTAPTGTLDGTVELREVTFAYPTRPDVIVFNKFSLLVPSGQVTALVGESGSGKSTIINLVERFYDVQSGCVYIDGYDIRALKIKWLRERVGLVSQEPALFNGTIMENIMLGNPESTMDDVKRAAQIANATTFIEAQPDQYGTLLGEGGGISLSGGQKQRIAIARAVLKDPRILLLDEATSALDAESERVVQDALDKLMVGRTSIVVAHRLTTIRNADQIAVVQNGVVLEIGSHDELMQRGGEGAYVKLAKAQAM